MIWLKVDNFLHISHHKSWEVILIHSYFIPCHFSGLIIAHVLKPCNFAVNHVNLGWLGRFDHFLWICAAPSDSKILLFSFLSEILDLVVFRLWKVNMVWCNFMQFDAICKPLFDMISSSVTSILKMKISIRKLMTWRLHWSSEWADTWENTPFHLLHSRLNFLDCPGSSTSWETNLIHLGLILANQRSIKDWQTQGRKASQSHSTCSNSGIHIVLMAKKSPNWEMAFMLHEVHFFQPSFVQTLMCLSNCVAACLEGHPFSFTVSATVAENSSCSSSPLDCFNISDATMLTMSIWDSYTGPGDIIASILWMGRCIIVILRGDRLFSFFVLHYDVFQLRFSCISASSSRARLIAPVTKKKQFQWCFKFKQTLLDEFLCEWSFSHLIGWISCTLKKPFETIRCDKHCIAKNDRNMIPTSPGPSSAATHWVELKWRRRNGVHQVQGTSVFPCHGDG